MKYGMVVGWLLVFVATVSAQRSSLSPTTRAFVSVDAPIVALTHVRVIDGTGAPAKSDQTVILRDGAIAAIDDNGRVAVPAEARVMNGAKYLGREAKVGSIAVGKQADLTVVRGDPSTTIADIEQVETVFKDGIGYDSAKLIAITKGLVGLR